MSTSAIAFIWFANALYERVGTAAEYFFVKSFCFAADVTGAAFSKQVYHQLTFKSGSLISKATKVSPAFLIATLLDVEPEEDGNAIKKGTFKCGQYWLIPREAQKPPEKERKKGF